MKLAAIDPNTKKLAFVLGDPRARRGGFVWGELPLSEPDRDRRLQEFARGLLTHGVGVVAYETPYLGINPKTHGVLSSLMGSVKAMMCANGLGFVPVAPVQWQSACLGGGMKRDQIKRLSMAYAADVLGAVPGSEDLADAVCIHRFVGLNLEAFTEVASCQN